ncbi:protein FAM180A-like [Pygocentrus nattereri]|uniref:Globin family profile domain-containing protein n=1 Tax=Pygocentrus nattereri TaxID=42514 RepID=A0AAR2J9C9_PYGNA|nr:protein FAM180A-like [Pygocentrus nattereri]
MPAIMLPWIVLIISLFYCNSISATYHRRRGFFPSALRVKRGTASLVNPIFQNSIKDVNLLFEILLAGLQFEDERGLFSVHDEELASLRQTHKLEVICEDIVPKTLPEVHRLTSALVQGVGALTREDFERLVLTLVYTAQQMAQASTAHQRDAWAGSFTNLYNAIKKDLSSQQSI